MPTHIASNDPHAHSANGRNRHDWREAWIRFIVRHRIVVFVCAFLFAALSAVSATRLHKDTSSDAFTDPNSHALAYRRAVVEHFGLKDPVVIAIQARTAGEAMSIDTLTRVRQLSDELATLSNIDPDRVASVTTKVAVRGGADGLEIDSLLKANSEGEIDAESIEQLTRGLDAMPIYDGVLISRDRTMVVVAAELIDHRQADRTYEAVAELVERLFHATKLETYVAGEGAVSGYLSTYLDTDARRLVPLAIAVVALILFGAFLTIRGAAIPLAVATGTVLGTLGLMAACDAPYSSISNGMVVALIGIAVADAIHVFTEYYAKQNSHSAADATELTVSALTAVWRPMFLTSITTVGGFVTLWATGDLNPIRQFGLFGAFGVALAWLLTVTLMPALMSTLSKKPSRALSSVSSGGVVARPDVVGRTIDRIGHRVLRYPRTTALGSLLIIVVGAWLASGISVDFARVDNFSNSAPIRVADRAINASMGGTNHLDVVIELPDDSSRDILSPEVLTRIDALQTYLRGLPHVGASASIADIVKSLNKAANDDRADAYAIPNDADLIAQLMVSYQASASPVELQALIDGTQRKALIRTYVNSEKWSEQRKVVHAAQAYIDREFAAGELKATLTGRTVVDNGTIESIRTGHWRSVVVSTLIVTIMCMVLMRSAMAGLLCLIPVAFSIALVYGTMGAAGIWLTIGTSMFASVAIGLGIDFGIHAVERYREACEQGANSHHAAMAVFQSTGRAAVFNAATVAIGFGTVMFSQVPPIRHFGLLVAVGILGAFIAMLTLLPAALKLLTPKRAALKAVDPAIGASTAAIAVASLFVCASLESRSAHAAVAEMSAQQLMHAVAERNDGASADRVVEITLIDRNGGARTQVTRAIRKDRDGERRSAVYYLAPANVRGTAFLAYDYADPGKSDDQWLYLPALRKTRRIPSAQRGDYFLGTDLTYDEIRNDNRVTLSDWVFTAAGKDRVDGQECVLVDGVSASDEIKRELGYARARWCIDTVSFISRRVEYWDRGNNQLKTVWVKQIEKIGEVWTATRIEVQHHKTGHRTQLVIKDSKFDTPIADSLFTQAQLERGI